VKTTLQFRDQKKQESNGKEEEAGGWGKRKKVEPGLKTKRKSSRRGTEMTEKKKNAGGRSVITKQAFAAPTL